MYILIITNKNGDIHTKKVCENISKNSDAKIVFLDTEDFGCQWLISLDHQEPQKSKICFENKDIYAGDIKSVWWRKPTPVNVKYMKDEMATFVFRENNDLLYGFLWAVEASGGFLLNHPFNNYRASIKPLQLIKAKQLGLLTPETLITNSPTEATHRIEEFPCISKGVSMSWAIEDDINHSIFVKPISEDQIKNIAIIKRCPATIQKLVQNKVDIRIVVLMGFVFCFRIKAHPEELDWRKSVYSDAISYEFFEVDEKFSSLLVEFNKSLDINFSAFDFVLDDANKLLFLETNPNGQWLWLDEKIDYKISKKFSEVLNRDIINERN